jgi:hypothetical protein
MEKQLQMSQGPRLDPRLVQAIFRQTVPLRPELRVWLRPMKVNHGR